MQAQTLSESPRIWLHAVSLGEMKVAAPMVRSLRKLIPDCSVILSAATDHGVKLARETFGEEMPIVYAPIDTIFSVRMALDC
jgi:3-deoxy-D-manno-octulosonic-acid transferase